MLSRTTSSGLAPVVCVDSLKKDSGKEATFFKEDCCWRRYKCGYR
jgi:hypothetical protein